MNWKIKDSDIQYYYDSFNYTVPCKWVTNSNLLRDLDTSVSLKNWTQGRGWHLLRSCLSTFLSHISLRISCVYHTARK